APQPDWPSQVRLTGFLCFDGAPRQEAPADVREGLDGDTPLVVFTPGTAIRRAPWFFHDSIRACQALGCRALFLTPFRGQLPGTLPAGVRHFDYLPLSQTLARAAALVHTGGIGTVAQGLAAGVPQVVVPLKNDQPDNACRLERLGVARALPRHAFGARALAR